MTYISRFAARAGTEHTVKKLADARRQTEHSFPDDGRREIPEVRAVFEAIEEADRAARALEKIFEGPGPQSLKDFLPGPDGTTENERQMTARRSRGLY
jgi:hypothetical protein